MVVILRITKKSTGEILPFIPVWYYGSYKFDFYNTDTKEIFSRSMDMYRARKYFSQSGVVHPESYYVSVSKRCLRLANYIDYSGAWRLEDLPRHIRLAISEAQGFSVRYIDDDTGFYISTTDGFHTQYKHMSIVEALFELKYVRFDNKLYFSGTDSTVYEYIIEDIKGFDTLYTKLNVLGVGR